MTFQGDPYRTLGLAPGASVNEIRSAYRRLAKRYHPDAAGERALPRFLAIQAAYEALVDADGDLRRTAPAGGPPAGADGRGEPWRADPSRAGASREAWRARGRSGSTGGSGGPAAPPGSSGGPPGTAGTASDKGDRRPPGGHTEHHHRRHRRTATPGSTTYDEAGETTLDAAWDGDTWYGASSGTYWTLNPREYADPRKHGPEYRRRTWRVAGHRTPAPPHEAASAGHAAGGPAARRSDGPTGHPAERRAERPVEMPRPGTDPGGDPAASHAPGTVAAPPSPEASRAAPSRFVGLAGELLPERLLARAHGGLPGRTLVAIVATVPAPWLAGVVLAGFAGCSAAGCPPGVVVPVLAAWAVAALLAAAVPAAAALGAFAVLVASAGSLVSAVVVAVADGGIAGAVATAAGSLGIVLYCFALVVGGARLYGRRERDVPGS